MKPKKKEEKKHKKFNSKKTIQLLLKYPEKAQLKVQPPQACGGIIIMIYQRQVNNPYGSLFPLPVNG